MKHLFIIPNNNMNPIASKGDLAIFEHMKLGYRMANSIYIIEYKGVQMIARIQLLIKGGISLLFDGAKQNNIKIEQHNIQDIIFIGHVVCVISREKGVQLRYSLYRDITTLKK